MHSMTKSAHFLPMKTNFSTEDYVNLFIQEIVNFYGALISIISDGDTQFSSHFWHSFQKGLETKVNLSTSFPLQKDGQTGRIIQTLEDMLRAYVIDFNGSCVDRLPLI